MGATITTGNPTDFTNRLQTYFNPKLLESINYNLVLAEYGLKGNYPAIGTSIRFFRPRPAITQAQGGGTNGPLSLTEGTVPTNLTEVALGYVDVPLAQRGALAKITDLVQAVDLLNTLQTYTSTMGADAALDLDVIIRNALVTALNDSNTKFTGYWERFAGAANTGTSSTDFTTFHALAASAGKITRAVHLACVTQLKAGKVPTINGQYVAVTPPEVIHDIRQDTTWVTGVQQQDIQKLYKRAQIQLDGCVFVEATNPFRETAYKTYAAAGADFSTIYLGDQAFGVPQLANNKAGGSPYSPKMIMLANADKSDPLNQITTIGWKAYYGAKALIATTDGSTPASWEVPHYIQLRTKTTFA